MTRTDSYLRNMITKALAPVLWDMVPSIEKAEEINAAIEARLLELFPTRDVWVPEEHKPGHWSLKNRDTGEQYRTGGRHAGVQRLVTFITHDNALRKADELNRALMS